MNKVNLTSEITMNILNRRQFLSRLSLIAGGVAMTGVLQACATATSQPAVAPSVAPSPTQATSPTEAQPAATNTSAPATTEAHAATSAPADTAVPSTSAGDTTPKVVVAAEAFIATLSDAQKSSGIFDFNDDAQRARWSNFPTGIFQRAGLRMGDLEQAQRDTAMAMLATILSTKGYQQVVDNVAGDEVLKGEGGGGGNLIFGKDEYHISLLGTPSITTPWMVQFGGHHLAINATIVGANITLGPSLTGGQPISYTLDGKTVRQLGDESDKAFALIGMLDAAQQSQAVLGSRVIDLVLGPGNDGKAIQPEGIKGSALNEAQQTALLDLINERVGLLNDASATSKMAEIKAKLAETYLAWYGSTTSGSAAYWRVQGPTFFMEFSPQSMGGSATNHIHAMYRETSNDYGVAWR